MSQNENERNKSPVTADVQGRAVSSPTVSSPTVSSPTVSSSAPPISASAMVGVEAALLQLIQLIQKLSAPRSLAADAGGQWTGAAGARRRVGLEPRAREELRCALANVEPDVVVKLHSLMLTGKGGQSFGTASAEPSADEARAALMTMADAGEGGPGLIEHLRRGHALACAANMKLDEPLSEWHAQAPRDLDERAWLSFGKQLASSHPDDWRCLGILNPRTKGLDKLYLKLGDSAWWSFQTVLDRPTLAGVESARRALAKRHSKGISTSTLQAVVGQLAGARGRALRRASKAIYARVGHVSGAARP